ncbi:hypothetical protein CEUSTIGMA_g1714.t1 [Chlamydomonas eustigma]|uniref:Aminotransferase class V domain-containing protein n=1 Tax=Chlamydomonas eustigma TaxID=1157962 RepID=A0A250WTZ4_9CHLO|nr:hypothetical protein CEUSTIGMA_g1714.t1 [Chlamydomonas eustigma]|eukprot:GAX74265.1 hypothetical protein CEUSTIGMA_g1714.t1 [Chlamydomonas eustigma]
MSELKRTGYQNFGSFFTESVEVLISKAVSKDYTPPLKPFQTHDILAGLCDSQPLGKGARELFLIDFTKWTFLNHGAFGGVCKPAHVEATRWRLHCETQPLTFLDRELFPQLVRVIKELGSFINASPKDLVFLPNATTGLNTVIKSCDLGPCDVMYMLDIGYGSVKKMAQASALYSTHSSPADVEELPTSSTPQVVMGHVDFPISGPDQIIEIVAQTMPQNTKLAVFDAVTSNTALVLPMKQLVELCKSRGIPVLIDAAHAPGQLPVDLHELNADYYVANCHKWLACPRGSAFMWVHPDRQSKIRPLVISHGSGCGFTSDFIWDGCRDYAPFLGVSSALGMWQALGFDRCRTYCQNLLRDAVDLLTTAWRSRTLAPPEMCANMALIALPEKLAEAAEQYILRASSLHSDNAVSGSASDHALHLQEVSGDGVEDVARDGVEDKTRDGVKDVTSRQIPWTGAATSTDAKLVQDILHHRFCIECPVKCIQGILYVRVSVQIYNEMGDYQKLGKAIKEVLRAL